MQDWTTRTVRLTKEDDALIRTKCRVTGMNLSDFIRGAIRAEILVISGDQRTTQEIDEIFTIVRRAGKTIQELGTHPEVSAADLEKLTAAQDEIMRMLIENTKAIHQSHRIIDFQGKWVPAEELVKGDVHIGN